MSRHLKRYRTPRDSEATRSRNWRIYCETTIKYSQHGFIKIPYSTKLVFYSDVSCEAVLLFSKHLIYFEIKKGKNTFCLCNIWKTIAEYITEKEWYGEPSVWDLMVPKNLCKHTYSTFENSTITIVTLTEEDTSLQYLSIVSWLRQNNADISKKKAKNNWVPVKKILLNHKIKSHVLITLSHGTPRIRKQKHNMDNNPHLRDFWSVRKTKQLMITTCVCDKYKSEYFKRSPALQFTQE